ncbi:MAG: glycosyltransferase family 2 protein [Actinomycetota bacterium]
MRDGEDRSAPLAVSVIITTYNRCDALAETLRALDQQDLDPARYEIIVVDNGCVDETAKVLAGFSPRCGFVPLHVAENAGISGARNLAISHARGELLVLVSDDLIVPPEFLTGHLETHRRFPGYWVVGGFRQLDSLTDSPFGRFLDHLECSFEEARKEKPIEPEIWELKHPTARNLSLPRADLDRIGLFDPQFRNACEDIDLSIRAKEALGARFLYNEGITCLHNDQAGDLIRYCRAQQRGAHDTVLFCRKYQDWYQEHGDAAIMRVNAPASLSDGPQLLISKLLKALLATSPATAALNLAIRLAERAAAPKQLLWRLYRLLIGIYIRRGWQEGLRTLAVASPNAHVSGIGCHPHV